MNTITIDVATHESALDLYAKLAEFHPDLEIAENGTCSIFLGFVGETDVVEVMDAIHQHLIGRGEPPLSSVTLALSNADRLTSHHEMAGLDMTSRPN